MVEFAIILPLMLLLLAGAVDLGRLFFGYVAVENAAKEGALYGARYPLCVDSTNVNCDQAGQNVQWYVENEAGTQLKNALGNTVLTTGVTCRAKGTGTIRQPINDCVNGDTYQVKVSYDFNLVTPILSNIVSRRRSTRVPDQCAASPASTVQVAVAAVVKTACTPRATAVAVWTPIASAEIASNTTVRIEPGSPPTATQTVQNASCTNAVPSRPSVTRAGQSTAGASRGINLAVAKAPAPKAQTAIAACRASPESCEHNPTAIKSPLPVMKAENTFPSASQASASTEPAASASATRSASRTR